jgi:hypothetical protein
MSPPPRRQLLLRVVTGCMALGLTSQLTFAEPPSNEPRKDQKADNAAAEKAARDALARFNAGWKDYTNEPNLGDARWRLKMETLVRLAKAGPAAVPVLEGAAKGGSPWPASTRELAARVLEIVRGPAGARQALADYDLAQMDTAHAGKAAPDFALNDALGKTHRLSQFRGKKAVVLAFVIQDT